MKSIVTNKLLQTFFEASMDGILIVDVQGKIVLANRSCLSMFGYGGSELLGKEMEELIAEKVRKHYSQFFTAFFEEPHTKPLGAEYDLQGKRKSGELFPIGVSLSYVEIDSKQYAIVLITDITKQKLAVDENSLLSKIFHESLNDIYIIDAQSFRFIKANAGALSKIGYSLDELQQLTPWDLKIDHYRSEFIQRIAPILAGKEKKIIFESVFVCKDHSTFPVEIHLQLFEHEGRQVFMETVIDNTEKRKSERDIMRALIEGQELERERIAKELHDELGQALTAMQLNLQTLEILYGNSAQKPTDIFEKLKVMLHNTIQEVRSISRNLMPSVLRDYGLVKALEYLCQNFNDILHLKVQLQVYNMEKKLDASRRVALYRIAQELINNAYKHGKAKEVNVQLIKNKKSVVLTVEDNGIGFNPAGLDSKSGFGLKNIESRIIAFDGILNIDSQPGQGAYISVEIPLKEVIMSSIRIMIVDDHQMIRDGIKSSLSIDPNIIVVEEAASAKEALSKLEKNPDIDVVVMDISLGEGEDGIKTTKTITEKYKSINILAMSMHDEGAHILNMLKAGAIGYILKGQGMNELVEAIKIVATGENYFSKRVSETLMKQLMRKKNESPANKSKPLAHLTKREIEVLKLIAEEYTNQEIAEKLFISSRTVDSHRRTLMQKLNVKNTAGLVRYALNHGLTDL